MFWLLNSPLPKPLDLTGISAILKEFPHSSLTMDFEVFCKERYLSGPETLQFLTILKNFCTTYGQNQCWSLQKVKNPDAVAGFSMSRNARPRFKGADARELLLAAVGQYHSESKPIIVRHSCCESTCCVNPLHYFYGTRQDAMWQHNLRIGSPVSPQVVTQLREECGRTKKSYASLAREFNLPYHTVRRICNNESFA